MAKGNSSERAGEQGITLLLPFARRPFGLCNFETEWTKY